MAGPSPVKPTIYHLLIFLFLGYAGLFIWVVMTWLAKARLVPVNHPYLEESLTHYF